MLSKSPGGGKAEKIQSIKQKLTDKKETGSKSITKKTRKLKDKEQKSRNCIMKHEAVFRNHI